MTAIFDFINEYILSYVMRFIMGICNNNFAVTIVIFTLFINALMIPLSIKSQKSSVQQIKIRPKLEELKRKYGDDRQKMAMAQQKLYQEENVTMSGGCLPMIIRLIFLMSIFYLITKPLSYLTGVGNDVINIASEGLKNLGVLTKTTYSPELAILDFIRNGGIASVADESVKNALSIIETQVSSMNFNLFAINLTKTPVFSFNFAEADILWVIPALSGITALFSGVLSARLQKAMNPDAPSMMGMNLIMPIFSIFIAFRAPGGLGFYWACSSLISSLIQAGVQYFYSPYKMIANERAKNLIKISQEEKKLINK